MQGLNQLQAWFIRYFGGLGQQKGGNGITTNYAFGAISTSTDIVASTGDEIIGSTVFNNTDGEVFLLLGSGTVSELLYTVKLTTGCYYETPWYFKGRTTMVAGTTVPPTAGIITTTVVKK